MNKFSSSASKVLTYSIISKREFWKASSRVEIRKETQRRNLYREYVIQRARLPLGWKKIVHSRSKKMKVDNEEVVFSFLRLNKKAFIGNF